MKKRLSAEEFFRKRRNGWWSTEGQERRKDFGVASLMIDRNYTREEIIRAVMAHPGTQEREKNYHLGLHGYAEKICDDAFLNWKPSEPTPISYTVFHLDRPPETIEIRN